MQQIKIFKSVESEVDALEDQINQWLKETGAKILQMSGNIAPQTNPVNGSGNISGGSANLRFPPSDVMIVIVYEQ